MSCTSNEIGNSRDVNTEAIYFDYAITGEEDDANITCRLQYRMGGPSGTTLVINEPGKVELDGKRVPLDSSKFAGAYYEVQQPVAGFAGSHSISFTDVNKEEYKENFTFTPFRLLTELPETLGRNDLVLELEGVGRNEQVRLTLTDTAFTGNGIHRVDSVNSGKLIVTTQELAALANGPITLILEKEAELPLKNATAEGGRLLLRFSVKREFELKD